MTCTFFGHRDTPQKAKFILQPVLIDFIENRNVNQFYVGNNGNFDSMVQKYLKCLKSDYPHIQYNIVLAYMPDTKSGLAMPDAIYPGGLEKTPPQYAIIKRNQWMINRSEYVITYVKYCTGGAAKSRESAEKKGKIVLNLADFASIAEPPQGYTLFDNPGLLQFPKKV